MSDRISESYVIETKKFSLKTELLSERSKRSHQDLMDGDIKSLNRISASLDSASRDDAARGSSAFRSLKRDESAMINSSFLHGLFFANISDLASKIGVGDSPYIKLSRAFGSFDAWQRDFVACAMSSRNGWAVTAYNVHLKRYVNCLIDDDDVGVPIGSIPVVVLDCHEHAYRDYGIDMKQYVFGMMKELNWPLIDRRMTQAERVAGIDE